MNLPFPSLPTDNLYKFVAIAGLILCLASPVYYQLFYVDLLLKNIELRAEMTKMEKDTDDWQEDLEELKMELKLLEASKNSPNVDRQVEQFRAAQREFRNKERAIVRSVIDRKKFGDSVQVYNDRLTIVRVIAVTMFILGLCLLSGGARLWYMRVQKPQDKILAKEAADAAPPAPPPTP